MLLGHFPAIFSSRVVTTRELPVVRTAVIQRRYPLSLVQSSFWGPVYRAVLSPLLCPQNVRSAEGGERERRGQELGQGETAPVCPDYLTSAAFRARSLTELQRCPPDRAPCRACCVAASLGQPHQPVCLRSLTVAELLRLGTVR